MNLAGHAGVREARWCERRETRWRLVIVTGWHRPRSALMRSRSARSRCQLRGRRPDDRGPEGGDRETSCRVWGTGGTGPGRANAGSVRTRAGQASGRRLREEAAPPLAQPSDALPADLAEALRAASTDDLLGWVEQARLQAERPLELEVAVTQTAFDRASSHRAEEALVLQGLQRQLAQVGPWWRPGSRRRRSELKARIAERQQVLTRLSQQLHQTERRVSELLPTRQEAIESWAAQQRRVLDRAAAAVQGLQQREHRLLDGHPFGPPERLESASATGLAVDEIPPRTGSGDDSPTPTGSPNQPTDARVQLPTPNLARDSVGLGPRRRVTSAGGNDGSSIAIVGGSITGPVLSLLLHQAGFTNVHIYEATPSAVPQAGGVIGLDHTSLGVLDTIGVPQEEIVPFPSQRVISVKMADRPELGRVQTLYPGRNTTWTAHRCAAGGAGTRRRRPRGPPLRGW